jgi:hypothetical protein
MALFFLEYDLRKQRDYQTLSDELKRLRAVHVLESTWCFNVDNPACAALRDHFRRFIELDDGLCVTQVTDWATVGTLGTPKPL